MMYKFILFFLICINSAFSVSYQVSFDMLGFLEQIQDNPKFIPDTKIEGATITIIDDDQITMEIRCDSLLIVNANQNNTSPTILEGGVRAVFYDENQDSISILQSDIAEYIENYSLVAKNNIMVYNLQTRDSLFFVNESSQIEWNDAAKRIQSDDKFFLKTKKNNGYECMTGSSFNSNVDLTDMRISNPAGSNRCE